MSATRTLDALATYVNGYPFKPEDLGNEGTPVIRIKQLRDPHAAMDRHNGEIPKANHVSDGDLLFSWSGSLAVDVWARGPAFLNQHLFKVLPAIGVDRDWLKFVLLHAIPELETLMHGSAMSHITRQRLKEVRVSTPALDRQRRIADFLDDRVSRIDNIIAARRQQANAVQERERSYLMGQFFEDSDTLRWKFPSARISRISRKLQRPPDSQLGVVTAFRDGWVGLRSRRRTAGFTMSDSESAFQGVRAGDLVFHGLDGFAGAFGVSQDDGRCSPVCHVFEVPSMDHSYVALALAARAFSGAIEAEVPSTRQRAVDLRNWGVFGTLDIPRPPLESQRRIARDLHSQRDCSRSVRADLNRSIALLTEFKHSLITAAVTGELDVATAVAEVPA